MWKFAILLLILIPQALAITIIDVDSGEEITKALVKLGEGQNYLITSETNISLPALEGPTLFLVRANSQDTYDYYTRLPTGEIPEVVYVRSAGKLQGSVIDDKENLIAHATVRVSCATVEEEMFTDGTGHFDLMVPSESCSVIVTSGDRVGSDRVQVGQGIAQEVQIVLSQQVKTQGIGNWWIVVVVVVLVIVLFIIWRPAKQLERSVPAAVSAVLKPKEKMVVEQLEVRGGRMKLAKLRQAVGLPRTSLLRTLESLESRGILVKKNEKGQVFIELVKKTNG